MEQFNDVEVEQNSKDIVCFLSKINIRELELNNKTNIDLNMILTQEEIKKYLSIFQVQLIDKRETIRFSHKKNYYVFIVKKQLE